ncbi:MAG: DUF2249 domain-containing protein [Cyclobacteriaceae bacterium]|nr:DUF2249 domain-containing protein [Cyclobacteriaceae bacterium]
MIGDKVLDVREIDKRLRKMMILNLFDALADGQKLELISDHSLAPLYKLFQKEKQGFFEWTDLENGPNVWRIAILKIESLNLTINDIVRQFPFAIDILENNGISYFKRGSEKLHDVCAHAAAVYEQIRQTQPFLVNPLKTDLWPIHFTADYIVNNHHSYVKKSIPEIENLIDHLVVAHAATHPQLPMIKEQFASFKAELLDHLTDEENIVFPSYKKLEQQSLQNQMMVDGFDDAISWMKEDHILTGSSLKSMRNFCNNYVAPADSSPGFKILFEELKKFEVDMHFHIHLENNVLFAKVMDLLISMGAAKS